MYMDKCFKQMMRAWESQSSRTEAERIVIELVTARVEQARSSNQEMFGVEDPYKEGDMTTMKSKYARCLLPMTEADVETRGMIKALLTCDGAKAWAVNCWDAACHQIDRCNAMTDWIEQDLPPATVRAALKIDRLVTAKNWPQLMKAMQQT